MGDAVLMSVATLAAAGALVCMPPDFPPRQVVVARYNEDLRFLGSMEFARDVVVYDKNDKGDPTSGHPPSYAKVARLPNEGREGHTYLHHIVTKYDDLADVTVFLPGSTESNPAKMAMAQSVMARAATTRTSAFVASPLDRPLPEAAGSYAITQWKSTSASNAQANPESTLQPSRHRPLGAWYQHHGLHADCRHVTYMGVFAASREHIQRRPREFYEALLASVSGHSNLEAGHYLERSWVGVFGPVPTTCITRYGAAE